MASSARQLAEARVGTLLDGKWTLDTFLGYGGSAAVYASTHRNGKRAAVKVLHAHCAADPDLVARFVREGYLANKIAHPGVVSVLDDDRADDGTVYLVMELLDGRSFERHGRGIAPPLSVAETLQVADDLLDILIKAHAIGLVHRDIKPANIFLTSTGQLKILDFGIARLSETFSEGVTQTGMLMGTPAYMPPEQARGRWQDVDARSDIWAVGVTLSSLLTGTRPRIADTAAEELLAAMMHPMPSLATILPNAPPGLVALVDRANAFERHDRWQSAGEMQSAVRELRQTLGAGALTPAVTLRFSPELHPAPHAGYGDGSARHDSANPTPPPTGQRGQFVGSTLLTPPIARGGSFGADPEPAPSLTTNRAMMRSAPPNAITGGGAVAVKKGPNVALFVAIACLLAVVGLVGIGLTFLRGRAAASARPTDHTATIETVPTALPIVSQAPQAPQAAPVPTLVVTAPTTPIAPANGAATAVAATSESNDASATSAAANATSGKKEPKHVRPPKPGPDGTVDPNKFFENRN